MTVYTFLASLSYSQIGLTLLGIWVLYIIQLAIQRLYLSPIAHFPGPKLAALTFYYEFYYDIILGGQYTFKILELHKKYGQIIRINPYELHVSDPDYFPEVYAASGRRRDRFWFFTQQVKLHSLCSKVLPS
jgi:hypothetical protein